MEPLWLARLHACLPPLKTPAIWREVCSESKPVLLATLLAERRSPTLILVPSLERAEQWLAILLRLGLSESQVLRAPAGLTPILEPTGVEPEVLHERIRALRALAMGEPVCVIAPITSALQTTLTPERFRAECLRLRTAETPEPPDALSQIEPADLLKQLVEDGYEYQEPVRLPGHFARRGGIVDVFPMGAELPLRIEFWGDEITSLRLYEPSSQRSIKSVGWAIVPPAREVPMGTPEVAERVRADWDAQIARQPAEIQPALRERLEDDLRPLQQGAPFDRLELYLPWLTDERACIVDYLPSKGLLVLDEPLLMRSAHERLIESLQQSLDSRAERGDIIPLEASRYVEPIERVFAPPQRLVLEAMETPDLPGEVYEIGTRSLETARGRLPDLWNSVQRWYEGGYQVVIATDRPNQVARVLKEVGLGYVLGSGQSAGGSRKGSGENALTHPSPPSPEASGEGGSQTPLSHSVGAGQGVRAKEVHGRDARAMNEEGQGVRAISLLIAGILLVLWFGVGAYLKSVWSMPPAETVRVAIIQPNVDLARAYHPEEWETVRAHLADLIQQAGTQQPDLIVFPEVMEPYPMPDSPRAFAWWRAQVQQVGIPILTGGYRIADRENDQWTNAQHLFLPDGTWHYHDKVQLVPLGERVPYREFLGFLRIFGVVERDMLPGKELRPLEVGAMRIGTVICMESSYPWVARGMVREGANLLVVGSNESWFGRTPALQQHLAFSVMRAIETRRWVVRSAPEGVSAFIAPNGKVQELTPFKPIVETAPVGLLESQTLAVRWGDWAIWVSAFFVAGCWMLKRGR